MITSVLTTFSKHGLEILCMAGCQKTIRCDSIALSYGRRVADGDGREQGVEAVL